MRIVHHYVVPLHEACEDMRNVLRQHCLHCNSPCSLLAITMACLPSGPLIRQSCCQQQTCRLAGMLYKSSSSTLSVPSCSGSSMSFLFPSRFLSCSSMYFSLQEQILQPGLTASHLCGRHQPFPELPEASFSFLEQILQCDPTIHRYFMRSPLKERTPQPDHHHFTASCLSERQHQELCSWTNSPWLPPED